MPDASGKIRVLELIHTLETGGAQKVIVNLICGIDKERFDITTACMQKKGPVFDEIKTLGTKVFHVPKKSRCDIQIISRLQKFIEDGKFDIVHTHNFSAGLWGRLAASRIKKNRPALVHTEHGRRGNIAGWRKYISRHLAKKTDLIIAVSDETRKYLIQKVDLPPEKIIVLKNGIDINHLITKKDDEVSAINSILESDPDARFIVNVSALSEVKDHATLLRAFKILKKRVHNAHLLLVGDGHLRLNLQKLAISLEINNDVHFLGERHDIAAILNKCDIFVLSSRNEGHPISLLEAMGMGVVPVATDVGGIPELIENTVNGLTVPPGEPSLLADAIRITLENQSLYHEWSAKSQEIVFSEYTAEIMAKKHEDVYSKLISHRC